jgi:hypothetical protein
MIHDLTSYAMREVKMRAIFRNAMTLTALAVGMTCACLAQSATPDANLTATVDPPAAATPATPTPAAATPATPSGGTDATNASSTAPKPELQPTVAQELDALKSRIDQLENEVKEEKARALADSADTAAIKAAEKELVAGDGGAGLSAMKPAGVSPTMQAAAPAAPPEIGAQTTTKGEPFPGDWT